MKGKITKRVVDAMVPGDRDVLIWDSEIRGFGVKLTPKGVRTYIFQYWLHGRTRRITIGRHGADFTPDEARTKADQLRGRVANGEDPATEAADIRALPSVAELADRYLTDYATPKKKASSLEADRRNIANHVKPLLGHWRVDLVTPALVDRAIRDIAAGKTAKNEKTKLRGRRIVRGGTGAANRTLALLSKMFAKAENWFLIPRGSNPCRDVEKYPETRCQRFLSTAELVRLGEAITAAEGSKRANKSALAAIRLLILTGCRLREILELKWDYVDFQRNLLLLPDSKSGAKAIHLSPPAKAVLAGLDHAPDTTYVLPRQSAGRDKATGQPRTTDRPLAGLQSRWEALAKAARIEGVRIHDLRHSFASAAAASGLSLPVIGALLGHSQPSTTARYAHLADNPGQLAAARVGSMLDAAIKGKPLADVVPLRTPEVRPSRARKKAKVL